MTTSKKLYFRKATQVDVDLFFAWANDPVVRQNAINSQFIQYEDHVQWFKNKISDPNAYLYVAVMEGDACGQIRFDMANETAEIDFSIDKQYRGRGLGSLMLEKGLALFQEEVNHCFWVKGVVKKSNIASQKAFQKAGFHKQEDTGLDNDIFTIYYK